MVELQSLWAKQTAVVVFLRRFGWQLCRLWSTELSSVKPQLDAHNVKLCGVGLEELGLEEFQEGKFFTGGKLKVVHNSFQHFRTVTLKSIIILPQVNSWPYKNGIKWQPKILPKRFRATLYFWIKVALNPPADEFSLGWVWIFFETKHF